MYHLYNPEIKRSFQTFIRKNNKLKAFTLTEMLIVLVIIGILILIALPNLMPIISKAKSTEAQLQLGHVFTLEKTYFYEHSKYSTDLKEIGFEQEKLATDGGNANYKIQVVEAETNTFKVSATAVVDFNGNGIFNVWEINQDKQLKETVAD
jgi:type IV pilus assembly protein PilE